MRKVLTILTSIKNSSIVEQAKDELGIVFENQGSVVRIWSSTGKPTKFEMESISLELLNNYGIDGIVDINYQ